jgi:N-acetylmuramic acid 6-phosphate etherase
MFLIWLLLIMTQNNETTESFPDPELWLDCLSPAEAMGVMADDQARAIFAVKNSLDDITAAAMAAYERLNASKNGRLIYAGAGTSARIGVQDGVELTPTFNWPENRRGFIIAGGAEALLRPIENAEDSVDDARDQVSDSSLGKNDVLIGIAASGKTPFTVTAVEAARAKGTLTIGIANNPDTPLLAVSEEGILLHTGAEALAGSTRMKAGTAQKICLNLISTLVMVRMGRVKKGMMSQMQATNAKLRHRQKMIDAALNGDE